MPGRDGKTDSTELERSIGLIDEQVLRLSQTKAEIINHQTMSEELTHKRKQAFVSSKWSVVHLPK